MDLRWTVVDASRTGASVDVRVSAAPGTILGAVHDGLHAAVGAPGGGTSALRVDGEPVTTASIVGLPPLLDGAVVVTERAAPDPRPPAPTPAGLLELHVVAGPDAGVVVPLAPGRWTVGRAAEAHIRVGDLRLSRVHLVLDVRADGVHLRDTGSTNGTSAAGQPVHGDFVPVGVDAPIRAGSSTLMLRAPGGRPAVARPDGRGHLLVNRPPRIHPGKAPGDLEYPAPPPPMRRTRLPWPAMFLPLLVSVPLALWWRQPAFLLFAAMTPVMLLGQHVADRRSGRREHREREVEYHREVAATDEAVRRAIDADLADLESEARDLARLGDRRPDARGDAVEVPAGGRPRGPPRAWCASGARRRPAPATDARWPVLGRRSGGRDGGPSGCADHRGPAGDPGARHRRAASRRPRARALTGRPARCRLLPRRAGDGRDRRPEPARDDWAWATWLPHHRPDAVDPPGQSTAAPVSRLVVVDGARQLRERGEVAELLRDAEHRGVAVICLDDDARKLPLECRATVVIGEAPTGPVDATTPFAGAGEAMVRCQDAAPVTVALDLAGLPWAESLGRALARLRDATPSPGDVLPGSVSLVDLVRRTGTSTRRSRPTSSRRGRHPVRDRARRR